MSSPSKDIILRARAKWLEGAIRAAEHHLQRDITREEFAGAIDEDFSATTLINLIRLRKPIRRRVILAVHSMLVANGIDYPLPAEILRAVNLSIEDGGEEYRP